MNRFTLQFSWFLGFCAMELAYFYSKSSGDTDEMGICLNALLAMGAMGDD